MSRAQARKLGARVRVEARLRRVGGARSQTEADWGVVLEAETRAGRIQWARHEPIRLRLAEGAWYKPDYLILMADGSLVADEVKGSWSARGQEAARVRLKVAVEHHPWLRFRVVMRKGKGWSVEELGTP